MKKKTLAVFVLCVAVGGSVGFFAFGGKKPAPYETVAVSRGTVAQEVASTGRVKPAETIELAFEAGGRVKTIAKNVGARVARGEVLMQLGNNELYAEKAQADAQVAAAQAALEQLARGVRPEELEIKRVSKQNAEKALTDAQEHLRDSIRDAYVKADDAVRNKTDQMFSNARTSDPVFTSIVLDNNVRGGVISRRVAVEQALKVWESSPEGDLTRKTAEMEKLLSLVGTYLDHVAFAINNDVSSNTAVSQMTIDGWRADIAGARANVSAAVANVTGAEQGLSSAESLVRLAKSELAFAEAGSDPSKITAQKAEVDGARAHASAIFAQIEKTVIRAPISGVITKQDIRVGESVGAYSPAVTMMSDNRFEIETFVPESDISFLHVGLPASVTLDAYTEKDQFPAKVAKIDPAETIIEGVATYKVTLVFIEKDERVRSGMTANITVESAKREDVVVVPLRAVSTRENGEEFVRVVDNGVLTEVSVKTGLRGSDGMVEIQNGVSVGDRVVTFMNDESLAL